MDTLITVIVIGMAVGYVTELLSNLLELYITPKTLKLVTSTPLSVGAFYLFGIFDWTLIVLAPAAAFFALAAMSIVNRPVILQSVAQRAR
jgi:hypothetical protein